MDLEDTGISFVPDSQNLGEFLEGLGQLSDADKVKIDRNIESEEMDEVIN